MTLSCLSTFLVLKSTGTIHFYEVRGVGAAGGIWRGDCEKMAIKRGPSQKKVKRKGESRETFYLNFEMTCLNSEKVATDQT